MEIELKELIEDNFKQCFELKVSSYQTQFIASNEESWNAAKEIAKTARPFAIYCNGKMVGFTMFAFDEDYEDPNDRYWLWRFMIDERYQRKGYGTAALKTIIEYFRDHGANNIRLSTKPANTSAINMYRKAGFRETGEVIEGEVVMEKE